MDDDGWETVYATGGFVRPVPLLANDIRLAVAKLRKEAATKFMVINSGFRMPPVDLPPAGGVGAGSYRGPFR